MKVSIIIPVYNVAPYIEACLQSVFSQTYKDIEVIIIDDCGTDNSMEIVKKIVSTYKGTFSIKIIHHDLNRGLSSARNTGIKNATGDYIYFLDSDDTITTNCITLLSKPILRGNHFDFIIADYQVMGSEETYPPLLINKNDINNHSDILNSYCQREWYSMAVNKLINKNFILRNKLFFKDGLLHEDELWSFQLALYAQSMYVIKDKTYYYYIRNNSITTKLTKRNFESISTIIEEIKKNITDQRVTADFNIYSLIEELKFSTFIKKYEHKYKPSLYNIYKNTFNKIHINNIPFKTFIKHPTKLLWEMQYYLPVKIAYYYCINLTKLFLFYKRWTRI